LVKNAQRFAVDFFIADGQRRHHPDGIGFYIYCTIIPFFTQAAMIDCDMSDLNSIAASRPRPRTSVIKEYLLFNLFKPVD